MASPDELVARLIHEQRQQEAILVLTLARMEEQATAGGWDQPPWLFMLHRALPPPELADALQGGVMQLMSVQAMGILPVPTSAALIRALTALANYLRDAPDDTRFVPELGPDMMAWVLINEGWQLTAPSASDMDSLETLAQAGHIKEHPNRVEVRFLLAVDRTLTRYQVTREREGRLWASIGDEVQGALHDALGELMEATP